MKKFYVTYSRKFVSEYESFDLANAAARAAQFVKNFPEGEVTILSIYPEGWVAPTEPVLTKMEQMVDGMRKKINSMLPKESA
jgi:hypothetical protein